MTDTEILEAAREYIRACEFLDDWNVPSIYTKTIREILNMEESPR